MRKASPVKLVWALLIGVLVVVAMYLSAGFCLSLGWHLFHGNSISYAGWTIPVPKRYYVRQDRGFPSIWTLSPGAPAFHLAYGMLSFHSLPGPPHPFSRDKDYPKFEESMTQEATQSGYQPESKRVISIGDKTADCWLFARPRIQPKSLARCAVEDSNIYAFYEGDPRYLTDLFSILQGMVPSNAN